MLTYLPFLAIFILLCRISFPSALIFFQLKELPSIFLAAQATWWLCQLFFICKHLNFAFIFLDVEFWVDSFIFLPALKKYHCIIFWLALFFNETLVINSHSCFPVYYVFLNFSHGPDKMTIKYLRCSYNYSLIFSNLMIVHLGLVFFVFILLGVCWAPGIYELIFFIKFFKCLNTSSSIFSAPIYCFSFWDSTYTYVRMLDTVSHITESLFSLIFSLFAHQFEWFLLPCLQVHWSFFFLLSLSSKFFISDTVFYSFPEFHFFSCQLIVSINSFIMIIFLWIPKHINICLKRLFC